MLSMRTAPVHVLDYGVYEDRSNGEPMRRRDGSEVEYVTFAVEGEEKTRSLTLATSVNGNRAPAGSRAELLVESRPHEAAELGRSGKPYIKRTIKFQVVDFVAVKVQG